MIRMHENVISEISEHPILKAVCDVIDNRNGEKCEMELYLDYTGLRDDDLSDINNKIKKVLGKAGFYHLHVIDYETFPCNFDCEKYVKKKFAD